MRYPQGGGSTDAGRAGRERIRRQAVAGFEVGEKARLEGELERGPLAHGWADQWSTLARVKTMQA